MNYTHILDCTSTRIMHNHFNFLSPRCPLPFPPCRRRLNPKRWYVWIFAPVTRTDPTNNILQELDLPHKYPQISPEDFVETSRPLNCGSVNSDKVGLYG